MKLQTTIFTFIVAVTLWMLGSGCEDERTPTSDPYELPERTVNLEDIQWPLSADQEPNSDISYAQYGPRYLPNDVYDFHAGIDLPGSTGDPVYPILPGEVVETDQWDGQSTGAGNAITVKHADTLVSSYLHLNTIDVQVGQYVDLDDVIGTVGDTGASYPHLHLGYFEKVPNSEFNLHNPDPKQRDERYSKNPLEVLPHEDPGDIPYTFEDDGEIVLDMPLQSMTANSIELIGKDESLKADYYQIVSLGWNPRKEQVQSGIHFDPKRRHANHQRFYMTVKPEDMAFKPERIIIRDFSGDILLDASR